MIETIRGPARLNSGPCCQIKNSSVIVFNCAEPHWSHSQRTSLPPHLCRVSFGYRCRQAKPHTLGHDGLTKPEPGDSQMTFETLKVSEEDAVEFVEISAPPMNLLGP